MRTHRSSAGQPAYYTIREAARALGVEPSAVARAIRVGVLQAVWRRGRFVIPARALACLLGEPDDCPCRWPPTGCRPRPCRRQQCHETCHGRRAAGGDGP